MKIGQAAALALALLAASPVLAQETKPANERLVQMPKELGGAPGLSVGDGMMLYPSASPGRDPTIGVMIVDTDKALTPTELRSAGYGEDSDIRRIVREGTFASAGSPGAVTFFTEFATGEFFKQNWMMTTGKQNIMVTITANDEKSARRAGAEVADKIFGGAVISAGAKDK